MALKISRINKQKKIAFSIFLSYQPFGGGGGGKENTYGADGSK